MEYCMFKIRKRILCGYEIAGWLKLQHLLKINKYSAFTHNYLFFCWWKARRQLH